MQTEQADHAEAQRIIEDSIHWYHENVFPFDLLKGMEGHNTVDVYCAKYCQYIEDKFGIRIELTETNDPMKRDVAIIDCNKQALTMLKLAMT